jgi:hypothetical protein
MIHPGKIHPVENFKKFIVVALFSCGALIGGVAVADTLDTVVVGQPYVPVYGGFVAAPVGPAFYPGVNGVYGGVVDNPNPALAPGPANPFFLSTVSGRGSPNWGANAPAGRFMLNGPAPGR